MTEDPNAVLAKFVEQRQIKLDAEREKNTPTDDRTGDNGVNPPAVRATDGGAPGTKEQNPLKMAAETDAETEVDQGPKAPKKAK